MSDSVENKIVSIEFDNEAFMRKMDATVKALDELNKTLQFKGAEKGFDNVSKAADGFDTGHMSSALDSIAHRFTTLGIIGVTTIAKLTTSALDFAKKIGGDILSPVLTGGKQRALNLEQAQFLFEGLGINVEKGMASALKAVKGTAFGLDEAAKIAAQFGAGGIKAGAQMTSALRGVAGAAALTGKSFSEIGDIFASSAAIGTVSNQDLDQFATRGLNVAAALAEQLGKTQEQVHEMARNGELDFKTFAAAMDKAFGKHATEANKTYTGSLANVHAAMSRLGAAFFTPNLKIQRDVFNALTPVIDDLHTALQPLIDAFIILKRVMGDRLIKTLKGLNFKPFTKAVLLLQDAFIRLYRIVVPILKAFRSAFREFFPINFNKTIVNIATAFDNFVKKIKIGGGILSNIKNIFRGFFAGLSIGVTVVKEFVKFVAGIFGAIFPATKGLLTLGSGAGLFVVNLQKVLVQGGGIHDFFVKLGDVIRKPIQYIRELADKIHDFFSTSVDGIGGSNRITSRIDSIRQTAKDVGDFWDRFVQRTEGIRKALKAVLDYITNWFKELGSKIADAFKPGDFSAALDIINVGLLGGIVLLFRNFVKNGLKLNLGKGTTQAIVNAFGSLTNTLKAMQTSLKAETLKKIAIAVGILTASIVVLSLIDSKALTKALVAITVSFGELIGAMTALDRINIGTSAPKLAVIAGAMILVATSSVILAAAIKLLSTIDLGDLAKGLTGVGAGLAVMVAAVKIISGNEGGIITASLGMIAMASAMVILASAVKIFATMSWEDMGKGLLGVAVGVTAIVIALNKMPASGIISGIGFVEIAVGMSLLAGAVKLFSLMNMQDLSRGLLGMTLALGLLVTAIDAMQEFSLTLPLIAGGILILATALNIMAGAVALMGHMSLGTMVKGLIGVAAMLTILVVAANAMESAIGGAASMVIMAVALGMLADTLQQIGNLSIAQIVTGLVTIAATIALIAGLSAALSEAIPLIAAMGGALLLVGAGFGLFGAGVFLLAKGFETLAKSGAAGAKAFVEILGIIATASTKIADIAVQMAIEFVSGILHALPLLIRLIAAVLDQLLDTVIKEAPKLAKAMTIVILNWLKTVRAIFPDLVETGFEMIQAILDGILSHIQELTDSAVNIMIQFMQALTERMPDLAQAGADLIVSFLEGIAAHLDEIITAGTDIIVNFLQGIANNIGRVQESMGNIIVQWIAGIAKNVNKIISAGASLVISFVKGIADNIIRVVNAAGRILVGFLNGLADAINTYSPQIRNAGIRVMLALINGMSFGLLSNLGGIIGFFTGFGKKVIGWVGNLLNGPISLVQKGIDIIAGFLHGILQKARGVGTWFKNLWDKILGWLSWLKDPIDWLFNSGVAVVQGLMDGMDSMKDKLKKKSGGLFSVVKGSFGLAGQIVGDPYSLVFLGLGKALVNGLGMGIDQHADFAVASINSLAKQVEESFQPDPSVMSTTLSAIADQLGSIESINPTITPVLDLSAVKTQANTIGDFFSIQKISPEVSLDQAKVIALLDAQAKAQQNAVPTEQVPNDVSFTQINNSPKALSTADIYRNTKSQIVLAKEELGIS